MKKILLATTMLVGTAGFAAADGHITFSGSAAAGIASEAGGPFETFSSVGLDVTFAGSSDTGLEFGATFGTSAGRSFDLGADPTEAFADEDGAFGMPEIFISGSFGRVAFSDDDYDMFDDANGGGDVKYTGTFGAFSVGLIADVDASEFSASADATFAGVTVHADADTYDLYNVSAAYTMGAFTGKVGTNEASDHYIRGEYAGGALSAFAQYNSVADGNQWEVGAGYSANGISVDASVNEAEEFAVTAGYDLGGGLSLDAGIDGLTSDAGNANMFVGASMSF